MAIAKANIIISNYQKEGDSRKHMSGGRVLHNQRAKIERSQVIGGSKQSVSQTLPSPRLFLMPKRPVVNIGLICHRLGLLQMRDSIGCSLRKGKGRTRLRGKAEAVHNGYQLMSY